MATDPRLDRAKKDYFVAGRLLFYARWDDHTTVADDTIAREAGIGLATVKRSLRRLEAAGWIRRRRARKTRENATGRVIVLCWKLPDFAESRKALADGTSAECISKGVAHQCANESLNRDRLESLTSARQLRVVVVEGVENSIPPQTPHSNDNDPDPGPAVLPIAGEECEARGLVEDLGGAMVEAAGVVERVDVDAEAARPAPSIYPMARPVSQARPSAPAETGPIGSVTREATTEPGALCPTLDRVEAGMSTIVDTPSPTESRNFRDSPAPSPAEGMTPGQVEFLTTLSPEKRSVFDGLSPGRKAEVLARRREGVLTDPMLLRMEAADLAPRRPVAAFRPVLTVEDAVAACAGGQRPASAMLAALLAREFDDQKSWPFFDQIGGLILANPAAADDFLDALRQARNPKAKNPGAVLVTALKRDHGW